MPKKKHSEKDTSEINTSEIGESNTMTGTAKAQEDATIATYQRWQSS